MAKKQTFDSKTKKGQKGPAEKANFFGTKSNMIVKEIKEGDKIIKLIAKDAKGLYVTYPEYVNSGLADPNRYASDRSKPTGYEDEIVKEQK